MGYVMIPVRYELFAETVTNLYNLTTFSDVKWYLRCSQDM